MASSVNNPAWLEWMASLMGGVSRQTYAATIPPDHFYCLLDELPLHLIPRQARASFQHRKGQPLFLNPECILCPAGELPDELATHRQTLGNFALQGTIAWVRDANGSLLPFWLGPGLEAAVRSLKPGEPAPSTLSDDALAVLIGAKIFLAAGDGGVQFEQGEREAEKTASLFREKGYAPITGLIHPYHIAALRRYYRYLIRTGAIRLGDRQSPRRYVAYNEPVARFFHRQIAKKLSAIAGEPLEPSYVYLASYLSGAELRKHTDREQCEYSITLLLDFSPEPELESPWPIRLDTGAGSVTLYQAVGDGLAYRGTRLPHYRDRLPEGRTSTSIFFHYVSEDFTGSLD
jgi:hypothetical protein